VTDDFISDREDEDAPHVPTLAQLVDQITPENRYSEVASGPEIGREIVEW
jgi:antitoxin component of MazEF toxin-antitoxin module